MLFSYLTRIDVNQAHPNNESVHSLPRGPGRRFILVDGGLGEQRNVPQSPLHHRTRT